MNLVEGLLSFKNKEGLFGGYANNEWAINGIESLWRRDSRCISGL